MLCVECSEGSSWHAYKVMDKLWMGGDSSESMVSGPDYSVDFQFGCQDSETGLFRTQNVDGIMGMSASEDTLPHILYAQKLTVSKIFSMCFSIGGGILTLGGVDQSIHNENAVIKYAKLMKAKGWYTVRLLDIMMRAAPPSRHHGNIKNKNLSINATQEQLTLSINSNPNNLNGKKGVIVDSGTTDTYLPSTLRSNFEDLFKKISDGQIYTNNNIILKRHQVDLLPTIVYRLESSEGTYVDIESPPSSYAEDLGNENFAFRIYLTESSGAVLGANVMNGHNVIFDIDNRRVGFINSVCKYGVRTTTSTNTNTNTAINTNINTNINTDFNININSENGSNVVAVVDPPKIHRKQFNLSKKLSALAYSFIGS